MAGARVLIIGSGFAPGEEVTVSSDDATFSKTVHAAPDGTIHAATVVPDWPGSWRMLTAVGSVSQYETSSIQMAQDQAVIESGTDGILRGWVPGEELRITLNDVPYRSAYATLEGTFDSMSLPAGKVEVQGTRSGGFFGLVTLPNIPGYVRPPAVPAPEPAHAPRPERTPAPEPKPEPEPTTVPEKPVPMQSEVPAPARPQPQAALAPAPDNAGLSVTAGTGAVTIAGPALFMGAARLRTAKHRAR